MTSRRNTKLKSAHQFSRRSKHETLERRELLAAELEAPSLIAVSANSGEQFDLQDNTVLSTAPTELKFRFGGDLIDSATLAGIQFKRAGGDGSFSPDAAQAANGELGYELVTPGFLGFEDDDGTNIIVARFAETLPDDQYQIELAGFDDTNQQIVGVRDIDGDFLRTVGAADPLAPIQTVRYEVEVGARVVSVVPQPIESINGTLTQQRDQVFVYFNDDPLSNPLAGPINTGNSTLSVVRPQFYKLIYTAESVENTDDLVNTPVSVEYDPALNRARLTFSADLVDLLPLDAAGDPTQTGTFRLRVGRSDSLPAAPQELSSGGGGTDTFSGALPLGMTFGSGTQSIVVTEGLIQSTNPIIPDWPGAYDAPGSRDNRRDTQRTGQADTTVGIDVFPYNFARIYGTDPQLNTLENAITVAQKQRVREVLDLYSERLGVEFVETQDLGLQIVTGDLRSIVITADTGAGADTPLSIYRVNERDQTKGVLVLDAGENWYDGYGLSPDNRLSYFEEALRGVGELLGIGDMFELPAGVAAGGSSPDEPNSVQFSDQYLPDLPVEPEFLSQSDITIGQGLHRPESNDVDFYSFTASEAGEISIETIAERLDGSSLLDTNLKLYRVVDAAADQYELIARNDDFYSEDSFIGVNIEPGDYIVGVSASGNDLYNGLISGSGLGGTSEGRYELRMTFKSDGGQTITDTNGTELDGDADGVAGGEFSYWFRVAPTVDNAVTGGPKTIFVDKITGNDAAANNGSLSSPKRTIAAALALSGEGDIVRILPNGGADGLITTQDDNLAYEIGFGGTTNSALADGAEFVVPKGVTVMIDAGALFKMKDAKISVGSETVDEDRSLAALQILGTPVIAGETGGTGEVFFTSWDDESLGVDTNPLPTVAQPGQWAGIEFRNDFDYSEGRHVWETEGIFLDFVSHANIQYGGGSVNPNEPIVTPIQMNESRPTIIHNTIRNSADAAISADPNSFRESNFNAPIFQRADRFTSDYDRVGPQIFGNTLLGNSINGLFVRVETPAAGQLEPMTVSGRFDDQDIVHVLSQVLVLQGQPGGAVLLEDRPDVLSVALTSNSGGTLDENVSYTYRVTYVNANGSESLASLPTTAVVTSPTMRSATLTNLPTTPSEFVGRRLYRSIPGTPNFEFVTQLDRVTTTFLDDGTTRGGLLRAEERVSVSGITASDGDGGSLTAGASYQYRFTYVNALGGETQASDPTGSFVAPDSGAIELSGIPAAPAEFTGVRIYRSILTSGQYELIDQWVNGESSYVDDGQNIDLPQRILPNDGNNGTQFLPRYDARLSIDPGLVIKLQNARIEAGFGADFYAEGRDGKEIIFTSRRDDTYGAGGTFDTNNDTVADNSAPGDWGGLVFRQDATGSLDFTEIRYGGGSTAINGQFTDFNAVEILQADVRIANSTIIDNASGFVAQSIRGGIGFNDETAIFVRGSQPVLVGNTIEGNVGAAISINPDSLNHEALLDYGRATGTIDLYSTDADNQGPLIAGNRLDDNTINGIRVRSEVLTTDSVWDDTDIVHVVEGEIASATHHYHGTLRLKSDPNQSLVVKFGPGGELVGTGRPLDINDRIGGTVQVLGTPGNPVILTSWNDSTVGAGFTADGEPMNCTLSSLQCDVDLAQAGDWQGIRLETYINDRNVGYILEQETANAASIAKNAFAKDAQVIGDLASDESSGDETERLGFNVRGTLATSDDVDVYSFTATGGTGVYIDIDETSIGLDTIVELVTVNAQAVNGNQNVLARSNDSFREATDRSLLFSSLPAGTVQPLYQLGVGNVESPNPLDAGMRVILPGSNSSENTYYIRVRSGGKSSGSYQLSLRLRETQEIAGSTVQLADIRFATDAITINSAPLHSPLTGTAAESLEFSQIVDPTPNNPQSGDEYIREAYQNQLGFTLNQVDRLGNLGTSDRGSLVVTGNIGNLNSNNANVRLEDVDVYQVDLFTQQIEPDVFDSENRFVTTTFDIDYADGLGRPNTSLAVYDVFGRLVLHSRDSNISDDRGRPLNGVDSANLTGGSAGSLDAYIGPVELPEGTYYVAVSNAAAVPNDLGQFFDNAAPNTDVRLYPINSTRRIVEETFDGVVYSSETTILPTFVDDTSIVPYSLDDMRLFVSLDSGYSGNNNSGLVSVNPFTGVVERVIGQYGARNGDIAARSDGELFSYSLPPGQNPNNGNSGNYSNVSPLDGTAAGGGDDGITFRESNQNFNGTGADNDAQLLITGIAYPLTDGGTSQSTVRLTPISDNANAILVGHRDTSGRGGEIPYAFTQNIVYGFRQQSGAITSGQGFSTNANAHRNFPNGIPYTTALGPASEDIELGIVDTGLIYPTGGDGGSIQGIAYDPDDFGTTGELYAVTDAGGIHSFDPSNNISGPVGSEFENYDGVIPTTFYGIIAKDPVHASQTGSFAPTFTGLTFGPRTIEDGNYRRTLFMTTADGWLYAATIDEAGDLEPANVLYNGRSAVPLQYNLDFGFSFLGAQPTGLAFSNLEASPWHITTDRNLNDGHGIKETPDRSREEFASRGGASLYYGFEVDPGNTNNSATNQNVAGNTLARDDGSNLGELAPGGSHGSIISQPLDLEGYSSADKPTLYFSYYLEVENNDDYSPVAPGQPQRDSFRVFAAGDDGEWKLLATNDAFRDLVFADEYDYFNETNIPVQELFDVNGDAGDQQQWRQARVDLSPLAGNENVRIRFDFSTAGAVQAHFDSVELTAIPGDEIIDDRLVSFRDENGNQIVLQNVVGTEVVFPAGNKIQTGDAIQLIRADGTSYSVQFVNGTAGPGQVQITSGMTANQVARAVIAALSTDVEANGPKTNGATDGRVRFASIEQFQVFGESVVAESNPVLVQRVDSGYDGTIFVSGTGRAAQFVVPDGTKILPGDELTVGSFFNAVTYEFVQTATGAANEIVYAPSETADQIARNVMSVLDSDFQAVYEGNGIISLVAAGTQVQVTPTTMTPIAPASATTVVDEDRIEITFPDILTPADIPAELITVKYAGGEVLVELVNQISFFPPFDRIEVELNAPMTADQVAEAVRAALPKATGGVVTAGGALSLAATSVTTSDSTTALSIGPATARVVTIPAGVDLIDGEILTIADENGVTELTFVESPTAGPAGTVNFQTTDTADAIAARVAVALAPLTETSVAADEVTIFGALSVVASDPTSNLTEATAAAIEVDVPNGTELTDGETLSITDINGTTVYTFVLGAVAGPDEINFEVTDTSDVIAARVATVLAAHTAVADNAGGNRTAVRLLADSAVYSGHTPVLTFAHAENSGDALLLGLTDLTQLRNGMQVNVFGSGNFERVVFIEEGKPFDFSTLGFGIDPIFFDPDGSSFGGDLNAAYNAVLEQLIQSLGASFETYGDPLGRGILVNDANASSTLADTGRPGIKIKSRDVNESAIPITFPRGSDITPGETVTIVLKEDGDGIAAAPVVLSFVTTGTGAAGEIVYSATDTAAEVTSKVLAQMPLEAQGFQDDPRKLLLLNAQSVRTATGSSIISYRASGAEVAPIIVTSQLTTREVASRLQVAVNEGVGQFVQTSTDKTSSDYYSAYGGDRIRLFNLTVTDAGGYGMSSYFGDGSGSPLPGDEFGVRRPVGYAASERTTIPAANNNIEGVYIDDIVVGFAERGEMVVESTADEFNFRLNPETLPDSHPQAIQPERQNEALTGPYSLEIRTSDEYGVPQDYDPINLELDEFSGLGRSFDTNDRLREGAVSLLAIAGTNLLDQDVFVLSDGWRQLTFEFDSSRALGVAQGNVPVPFNPDSPNPAATARAIRDAINSAQVQNVLNITAATSDGFESAANTGNRVELFGSSSITVNSAGGRFIKMDLVSAETSQGRETSRRIPIVDQVSETITPVIFGDELDRSTPSGFVDAAHDTVVGIGKIGDAVLTGQGVVNLQDGAVVLATDPSLDYDSVKIYLAAGETVDIDVDTQGFSRAGEVLDLPVITVFNDQEILTEDLFGFEIDRSRQSSLFETSMADGEADGGAFLRFTAPSDGYYNVVVSSANIFGSDTITFFDFISPNFLVGETLAITSGSSQVIYEYTLGGAVSGSNVPITLATGDDATQIASKTQAAISANQSAIVKADADGRFINLVRRNTTLQITPSTFFVQPGFRAADYGEYALAIRPTSTSGNVPARDVLMVDYQFGISDTNRVEDQGQLVISSNFISNSSGTGVRAVSDDRGERLVNDNGAIVPDSLPNPGSARLLRNQNTDSLIPGVVISNNVISGSGDAGIEFGGDVNVNGQVPSPAAFGRIVNNTVVNSGNGDGIRISGASSPTVLNNIVSGFTNGILATGNQFGEIVVGGNAFQGNNNNTSVGLASSSIVIPDTVALFQDPDRGIYIPAAGSDVIDSSFASLPDRSEFLQTVKEPVGIAPSPIIAPAFDAYGQPRVDDPLVTTPGGVGSNVFIDRGAIDRADDVRPTAVLTGPQDAIGFQIPGGDQDQDSSFVRLTGGTLSFFEVQLRDPSGTGIDPATVTSDTVILTENGSRLIPGRDYVFGFSSNSNTIRLTPLTGIWRPDAVYEITLNNKQRIEVSMPSGDQITDGSQVIVTEANGTPTTFEFEAGYSLVLPETTTLTVAGTNALFNDGEQISLTDANGTVRVLEFDLDGSVGAGAIAVNLATAGTVQQVRDAILAALASTDPGSDPAVSVAEAVGLSPSGIGIDKVQLGTVAGHVVTNNSAAITQTGVAQGVQEGDQLVYTNGPMTTTFEFTLGTVSDPAFIPIQFARTDSPDQIAASVAAAVASQPLGLGTSQALGQGRVVLGGISGDLAVLNSATILLEGEPGVSAGAYPMPYRQSEGFTPASAAAQLQSAIRDAGLAVTTFNPGGGTLLIDGALMVEGTVNNVQVSIGSNLPAVADLAGNRVRETRANDETRFTIIMPQVQFDFGDAPASYKTLAIDNGARHTVSGDRVPRLGQYLDTETNGQPAPLSDDALLPISNTETGNLFTTSSTAIVVDGTVVGGETLTVSIGNQTRRFEMIRATENPTGNNLPITFVDGESGDSIALKVFQEIRAEFDVIDSAVLLSLAGDTITLEAIDDEDGISIGTFVSNNVPYLVFTDDPTITGNVNADDVVGFLNPSDPSGSTIPVTVTGSGLVDIWVDFDGNGTFDSDEQIAFSEAVSEDLNPNPIIIPQSRFPADAVPPNHTQGQKLPDQWMRVRLSQSGDLGPTGVAVGGEVEDYMVSIAPFDPPVPTDDAYTVIEDGTLTVDTSTATPPTLISNDTNLGQLLPVRYFVGQQPQHGTLVINPGDELTGAFSYVPDSDFVGKDTFTYRLSTQRNSGSVAGNAQFATVTIDVSPVNDVPGVNDANLLALEFQPGQTPADQPQIFLASDLLVGATGDGSAAIPGLPFDESNQDAELRVISITVGGVTINANNQTATATTSRGATLSAEFATELADPSDPTTMDRTFITRIFYRGADYFNSDNLRAPSDPPLLDGFSFTVQDDGRSLDGDSNIVKGTPQSASANVNIRVTPQNSQPTPMPELLSITDDRYRNYFINQNLPVPTPTEDEPLVVPADFLLSNDLPGAPAAQDETQGINGNDGDLRITAVSMDPAFGTVEIDATTGDVLFTPADDIYGQVEFVYEVEDQGQDEAIDGTRTDNFRRATVTSTIFVEPVNDAPVAYDRSLSVNEAAEPGAPAVLSFTSSDLILGSGVVSNSPLVTTANSITVVDGTAMVNGETVIITDSLGNRSVVEFSTDATASIGTDVLVTYATTDLAADIATNLAQQLTAAGLGGIVTAETVSMPVVTAVATASYTAATTASATGISIPEGALIVGGETIQMIDAGGQTTTLELSTSGVSMTGAGLLVTFDPADDAATISAAIKAALIGAGIGVYDDPAAAAGFAGLLFNSTSVTGINDANSNITASADRISLPDASGLIDGETITLADGVGGVLTVEFNTTGTAAAGTDVVVQYAAGDAAADIAATLAAQMRLQELGATANGDGTVSLTSIASAASIAPMTSINATPTEIDLPAGDQLIDGETITLTIDGAPVIVEFNTTGTPAVDTTYVVTFAVGDSAADLVTNLETTLRTDGYAVTADGDSLRLSNSVDAVVRELPAVPGDFDKDLPAPYNESEQSLRVVSFSTSEGTVSVAAGFTGSQTLDTANGGLLTFNYTNGVFASGSYAPPIDYNELPPFVPVDLFTYTISDNGRTTLPVANLVRILGEEQSVREATVTISVKPANDKPYIENLAQVDVPEDPTTAQATIDDVFTTVLPGPVTAEDELLTQGRPTVTNIRATDTRGIMEQLPVVTDTGGLTVFPKADAVGEVIYVFTFTDDHPTNPQSTDVTVTVNVRPVNDAPRFNPSIAGTGAINTADDAYQVAREVDANTGEITDATITYTLREDNTQPVGQPARQYFIPLRRDPSIIGYNRVGLLDVFLVGPSNEASIQIEGGNQTLSLDQIPARSDLGGSLTLGTDSLGNPGVYYDPPENYNNQIGGVDSFTYTVIDDGTTYVNGQLDPDPLTSTNVVQFVLNPVNDKPQFNVNLGPADPNDPNGPFESLETLEDSNTTTIDNFAFGIEAAPPNTAFDEVDVLNGQTVRFSVTSLGFPQSQASDFFTEFPTITPDGTLKYRPAPDVFGSFDFEVVLTDDGPGNETRGDLISSDPVTITIDVLPVNDPPVVRTDVDPLEFTIDEDTSLDIPTVGTSGSPGLLDVFAVGPDNESQDLTPGGNQSVSLKAPTPVQSAFGGTITEIVQNGVVVGLQYTPRANFVGTDSFIYTVTDDGISVDVGTGGVERPDPRIASHTVSINVDPINNPPQFSGPSNVTVSEDAGVVSIDNWATNVLPGPPTAIDEINSQTTYFEIIQIGGDTGLFTSDPVAVIDTTTDSASLDFQTAVNANGVATFTAQLFDVPTDGTPQASSTLRTFSVRVNAINDPPTFTPGGPIVIDEDSGPYSQVWASGISPGPADEASQSVRFEVTTPTDALALFQTLPEISDDGILRFVPASNANGTVDLSVVAIDSGDASSTAIPLRLTITAVNDQPTAVADSVATDEDTLLSISSAELLANDIDPDINNPDDTLTIVMSSSSFSLSGARVQFDNTTGQITYDPSTSNTLQSLAPGEQAIDSFTYRVVDSQGLQSNIVSVAVTVDGINDAPFTVVDNPTLNPNGPTVIEVLANDYDVDGTIDPTSIQITLQPAFGSLAIDNNGVITFTSFQSFALEDVFRYRVADDQGEYSAETLVTISANAAPIARNDQAGTFFNESIDVNVVANDEDPDAVPGAPDGGLDLSSIQIVSAPTSGVAVPLGDGTVRYIPNDGFLGTDSFQYTIADSEGRVSSPGTVQIQVTGSRLQNPNLNADVNDDGNVSPIDALLVINRLGTSTTGSIPVTDQDAGPPYYDVNGDQSITPIDALEVINELARRQAGSGQGEQITSDYLTVSLIEPEAEQSSVSDIALLGEAPQPINSFADPTDQPSSDFIDLIANRDDDGESDREERLDALDAAFGDLI
ncbi:tandem-95 repeat protein [Stieleria sp. TO1_6]|uniref:tandem-95 repeat protein n=1 Tax=Stieleria tagensis TaxID=2956795 RepID=UPI00209B3940|nr:tandem-95 repeat protein [Stieleria tagensis]MCO8121425.1 tandem-95 repeat protein [Stieleria tagensis]